MITLQTLATDIDMPLHILQRLILAKQEEYGVKIIAQQGQHTYIQQEVYDSLHNKRQYLLGLSLPIEEMYKEKKDSIPIAQNSYIYYLYYEDTLVYIGKTNNLCARIGEHYRLGREYDEVAVKAVDWKQHDIIELMSIYVHTPIGNVAVLKEEVFFKMMFDLYIEDQ